MKAFDVIGVFVGADQRAADQIEQTEADDPHASVQLDHVADRGGVVRYRGSVKE